MKFKVKKREDPIVEIAPLIDVVFLLLLFFMVTTQFVAMPGIKLTLPGIKPGGSVTAASKIEIMVTSADDIYVDGEPTSLDNLPAALKAKASDPESAVVVLKADRRVSHGRIVALMDIVRRNGLKRVVFAVRWEENPLEK